MSRSYKKNKWDYRNHDPKKCSQCWHNRPLRQEPLPHSYEDEIHPAEIRLIEYDATLAPEDLIDCLQDRIQPASGKLLSAKPIKVL